MGTRELDDTVSTGEPSGRREVAHGIGRLSNECLWFRTSWFRGQDGLAKQLRQTTCSAEPHLQLVTGIGAGVSTIGELIAGRLVAKVEHQIA